MSSKEKEIRNPVIIHRLVLKGKLVLESPLLIGDGKNDNLKDTLILRNKAGKPVIPGTSIAGVLRSMQGSEDKLLFGHLHMKKEDRENEERQSTFIFKDVILEKSKIVLRDGVRINEKTGVGVKGAKFDYEAVERGAQGELIIFATVREWQRDKLPDIQSKMVEIGSSLQKGLLLGALTRRGFGKVVCFDLKLLDYDFSKVEDVKNWLLGKDPKSVTCIEKKDKILNPNTLELIMDLNIKNSLLVRNSDFEDEDYANFREKTNGTNNNVKIADCVQMKSGADYLIPGASVRGVIRHQARKIMECLGKDTKKLDDLFGFSDEKTKTSKRGRVITEEVYFSKGAKDFKQCRNKIDRFTGGTIDGALMTEIPVLHKDASQSLSMRITVEKCEEWEAGLLLLIVKDICTGQVAFGGEKSIGRGVMNGIGVTIYFKGKKYVISNHGQKLQFSGDGSLEELESFITGLNKLDNM